MTPPALRIKEIKRQLGRLHLGDEDTRLELLRELNQLQGGSPNKTDQQLLAEWYDPQIKAVKSVSR
jgi:hypothetical protein